MRFARQTALPQIGRAADENEGFVDLCGVSHVTTLKKDEVHLILRYVRRSHGVAPKRKDSKKCLERPTNPGSNAMCELADRCR